MLNLLIIDSNLNNSKCLLNYISENSSKIRVHSIANTLNEGIRILNSGLIDITVINVVDNFNSIIDNIHTISNTYFEKYKKSIIIISNSVSPPAPILISMNVFLPKKICPWYI